MSKWGKFEFSEFKQLRDRFKNSDKVIDQFMRDFLSEMAMRALRKIRKRTPVGQYPDRVGGQLRRNWKVGQVYKTGNAYIVEIYNNTEYAGYVEFGHRVGKALVRWVEGKFMMTISMQEIERELPKWAERRQQELVRKLLGG